MKQSDLFYTPRIRPRPAPPLADPSRRSIRELRDSGRLGRLQWIALAGLREGPLTGRELAARMDVPDLWKRLSELHRAGRIEHAGQRVCRITGKRVWVWRQVRKPGVVWPEVLN